VELFKSRPDGGDDMMKDYATPLKPPAVKEGK
jgi:hypothetical protein